ncbi:MAG: ABC transporter substrate binding protein [Candidatus Reddybacter sp.]
MIYQRTYSLLVALLLLGPIFLPCNALSSGLLIIYPSVKAPYNKIYKDIIKGIDKNYEGITKQLELMPDNSDQVLTERIEQYQPEVLVTLGRHSLKKACDLKSPIPIVAGAITKTDEAISGISMIPDPEIILSHLLTIAPFVTRVYIVADTDRHVQLERADTYLKQQGKILQTEEATSIQQAADKYLKIINSASVNDAIWLMRGASLNDPSILMLVLEAAWKKKIVVFSSNPTHVKRGALFSVYPDNEKMGGALAEIAQQENQSHTARNTGLVPLRNLHLVVNKRTSKHLGITPNNISGLNIHRLL